jgi:hypothetical protein
MAAKKAKPITINPNAIRRASKLNQQKFWSKLGVTQSGGSRYECGRTVPKPVRMLAALSEGLATIDDLKSGALAARI